MNEYGAVQLKFWQAQQTWNAIAWSNMQACPWLLWPPLMEVTNGIPMDLF